MSRRYEVGCGAVLVLGLATTAFLLLQVGALDGWGDQVEARVELPDAAGPYVVAGGRLQPARAPRPDQA